MELTIYRPIQEIVITRPQEVVEITVERRMYPINFRDFTFTATQGQTVFTLPSTPVDPMILVWINGVGQNMAAGDYTVSGKTITLSEGVDAGDKIFGVYQEA
jgi:hypothetical protein